MIQRITIDETVCDGCLICIEACPTDIFKVNPTTGKPYAAYPDDCHVCFLCQEDCPLDCLVVDPWNALGTGQVFAYVSEVVALRA